ncbi:MAG: hypothetical protein E7396_05955 [Ruminococcaceae bacterium]|nr:hypothetical protein [Oscillospiraceae bacterium]
MKKYSFLIFVTFLFSILTQISAFANDDFKPAWPLKEAFKICAVDVYQSGGGHSGIDTNHGNKTTQNVYPVADGYVTQVVNSCSHYNAYKSKSETHASVSCSAGNSGNKVVLKHEVYGKVYYSQYAHLTKDSINVVVGQKVTTDTVLGKMGSSGNSSGPHLHFSIYEGDFTNEKAKRTFDYYKNNPSIMKTLSVKKKLATVSPLYGNWIKSNGTLDGDLYYFNNLSVDVDRDDVTSSSIGETDVGSDKKHYWWHASYDSKGYCKSCGAEYSMKISSMTSTTYQAVKNDVPVRNRPYSPEKITKYLSKGTKVTVVASGKNSAGNLWYKLSDGTWIYSKNLEKVKVVNNTETSNDNTNNTKPVNEPSSVKISPNSYPSGNLKYGKDFTLTAKFTSDCAIVEARAYMLDSNKNVIQEAKGSSTTGNYYVEGYALDKGMKFDQLNPGTYYLKYYVKDANGDTATWTSNKFYIVKESTQSSNNSSTNNSNNSASSSQTIANGTYVIATKLNTNYVLDISGASKDNGANLQLWENNGSSAQTFKVTHVGNGYYQIVNTNSSKAIDVQNGDTAAGTNVWQYQINNTDAQLWKIASAGGGSYYIIGKGSGLYLDVDNANADSGTNVKIFDRNDAYDAQKWIFTKTSSSSSSSSSTSKPSTSQNSTSATPDTSIRFEIESMPKGNLPYGKSFSLKGWFRSDSAIVEARAYMLDANKNVVMQSEPASSTTSNYKIQGYKLDKAMKFDKLSPGGYYLKFFVRDANGDTFTWISDKFYIIK